MKGIKKIFINVLAICLVAISCFGLSACKEDVVKVQLNVGVYNYSEEVKEVENKKFSIDLYSYVAPKTVDAVTKYIKQGYYNDTFFYIIDGGDVDFPNQLMLGDLKMVDGEIVQNDIKPTIKGEFENGEGESKLCEEQLRTHEGGYQDRCGEPYPIGTGGDERTIV